MRKRAQLKVELRMAAQTIRGPRHPVSPVIYDVIAGLWRLRVEEIGGHDDEWKIALLAH